jgi:hypothetical protein
MTYYMDGPPEPEWAGNDEFTCSAEVNRKFITPEMGRILASFGQQPLDPWAEHRSPEQIEALRVRMMERRISELLREWARIEDMDRTCGWEGETECYIANGHLYWTCPACGEEHDDPADRVTEDPDPDRLYEEMRDRRMGLA